MKDKKWKAKEERRKKKPSMEVKMRYRTLFLLLK